MPVGLIFLGLSSSHTRGTKAFGVADIKPKRKNYYKKAERKNITLSDDEVRLIRKLDEKGMNRREIFKIHVEGKMKFSGMLNILNYITRTKVF